MEPSLYLSVKKKYGGLTCWVFETVQIILIIISLICFTEKVYGSSPYSPNIINKPYKIKKWKTKNAFQWIHSVFFQSRINKQIFLHFVFSSLIFVSKLHMNFPVHNQRVSDISFLWLWYTYLILVNFWSQNHDMSPVKNKKLQPKSNLIEI